MSRTNSYSATTKLTCASSSAMPGRATSTNSTPDARSVASAESAVARTPSSRSSQKYPVGRPSFKPRSGICCSGAASPLSTPSTSARSATLRASGPAVSRVAEIGAMPSALTRPTVGRNPATPHSADGTRTEPPVSVPIAAGTSRAATAAPEPPLLPPGMRCRSHGLRTAPVIALFVVMPNASSCSPSLPGISAPAARNLRTSSASAAGARPCSAPVPLPQGKCSASMLSFSAIGMPSSARRSPRSRRSSAAVASRRRRCGSKAT